MKKIILIFAISTFAFTTAMAQTEKEADPKDVASLDAIMKSVYNVISGDAGKARDWDRFRSLFIKDARLIPAGKNAQTGVVAARVLTPEDYIQRAGPGLVQNGFHEIETARQVDIYGNIAQVFSTYESRRTSKDEKP